MEPISPLPTFSLFSVGGIESFLAVIITIVFIWWLIFTLVTAYHWLRYARDSFIAIPAIAVHLFISGWIFVFATGGLH